MTMHIVHKGVTTQVYSLNIAGSKVTLGAGSRTVSYPQSARADLEAAIAQYPTQGDLDIAYDGLFYIDSGVITSSATPTATVTGLLATDIVVGVTQKTANANSLVPIAFGTPASNALPLTYASACGANGVVRVLVLRP